MTLEIPEAAERKGVRFDATINLGHILTFIGFLASGGVAWNVMDKRITVLEERSLQQERRDTAQDSVAREGKAEVREALQDVRHSLEKLRESIDRRVGR